MRAPIASTTYGLIVAGMSPSFASDSANVASLRGDRDVAARDEADAAAERRAVDARDRRLRHACRACAASSRERLRVGQILGVAVARHLLHPVEIGAGAEARARAQQHDGAHVVVARRAPRNARGQSRRSASRRTRCAPRAGRARRARRRCGPRPSSDVYVDGPARRFGRARPLRLGLCRRHSPPHIRNTPNVVASIGRLSDAEIASPSTRRVSAGSMTPSSHSRALAKYGWPSVSYCARIGARNASSSSALHVAALRLDRVAAHRREHGRRLLAAHHRDARVRPHPQEARVNARPHMP